MEHIKVYLSESSIHGFPYIVKGGLQVTEKILWTVSILFSFVCCGLLIFEIGVKYQEDAMVTYTSETAIAITDVSSMPFDCNSLPICLMSKIPFAAVTFCPDLYSHNRYFDYNQIVEALKQREMTIDNVTNEKLVNYLVEVA
jgi:hypothetical protein